MMNNPMFGVRPASVINPVFYAGMMQYYNPGCICDMKLAHSYVPFQNLNCVYQPLEGLDSGTIFPELDRPYGADKEYTVDK